MHKCKAKIILIHKSLDNKAGRQNMSKSKYEPKADRILYVGQKIVISKTDTSQIVVYPQWRQYLDGAPRAVLETHVLRPGAKPWSKKTPMTAENIPVIIKALTALNAKAVKEEAFGRAFERGSQPKKSNGNNIEYQPPKVGMTAAGTEYDEESVEESDTGK